jgi:hypothetical protein
MDICHGFPPTPAPQMPPGLAATLCQQVREELRRHREILATSTSGKSPHQMQRIALAEATLHEMGAPE